MHKISIACSPGTTESALEPNQNMDEGSTTIRGLGDHDVLCGRGNGINKRQGNREFREYVEEWRMAYHAAPRKEKIRIAKQVVQLIHDKGGRFLRYKEDINEEVYVDIGFKRSVEKASQALRETGKRTKGSKLREALAAAAKVKMSAARAGFDLANKTSRLWQETVHLRLVETNSGQSDCSSDDDAGRFEDAMEESAKEARTPLTNSIQDQHDEIIRAHSVDSNHQPMASSVHHKEDEMIQACSLNPRQKEMLSFEEEDGNTMMIEAVPYQANPREKPGVLLPPPFGSLLPASHPESISKQRAPIHDLITQPTHPEKTHDGDASGWFVDYFTNGGSGDTTPEANRKYWEELFLVLASFKETHGHCCIPPSACSPHAGCSREEREHTRLADWASVQRQLFREIKQGRRSATDEEMTRLKRLEALGFVFNYEEWHWNNKYNELVEFHKRKEEQRRMQPNGEAQNGRWKERVEFAKCLGLAQWVKEQRSLRAQALQGKFYTMPAERVKKLELINFSWADDTSGKSLGTSPHSVVALACSLSKATARTSLGKTDGKAACPYVDCSILRGKELNATKSANRVLSISTNAKLDDEVEPRQGRSCTTLLTNLCLSSPETEHYPIEKKATVSPETSVLEKKSGRHGAVTPESASVSRILSFSSTLQ